MKLEDTLKDERLFKLKTNVDVCVMIAWGRIYNFFTENPDATLAEFITWRKSITDNPKNPKNTLVEVYSVVEE